MKRISWRLGGRHTQRPALKPFISARVSFATNRGCSISTLQKNLCETDSSFHFYRLHCVLNLDEFGSSMTESFKRSMWRAGSGDGHHMEWREFHGGSAAATLNDQLWSYLSQPVLACNKRGCSISTLQKTCVRPTVLSIFIGCTAFWIWMNLVQVWLDLSKEACEEQEVEMDIIWNEENFMEARRPPQRPALKPFILARVSFATNRGCSISTLQKNLCETDNPFHFYRLHCVLNLDEFGSSMTRSFKRSMWRAGSGDGHHMEWREFHGGSAAATATSSEAIYLSPCQLCNQQRLFNLDASEKLVWDRQSFPFL